MHLLKLTAEIYKSFHILSAVGADNKRIGLGLKCEFARIIKTRKQNSAFLHKFKNYIFYKISSKITKKFFLKLNFSVRDITY